MTRFLVAHLDAADAGKSADWLADDAGAPWREVDPIDLDDACVERVFDMYSQTYRDLGEPFLSESGALFKYNRWVLFYAGNDRSASNLIACALFDVTSCGLKGRLRASDLAARSRQVTKDFAIASYNARDVFGEISGRLEAAIADKVHVVPVADALKVLRKLGHIAIATRGDHYERAIRGETTTKLMVGHPRVPDDADLSSLPASSS